MALSEVALKALGSWGKGQVGMTAAQLELLLPLLTEHHHAKGDTVLAAGEEATTVGLVIEGIHGEFYVSADGKRRAKCFVKAGELVGSMEDLVRGGPARTTIESLTKSHVLCMAYADLRALAMTQPVWTAVYITGMEDRYRKKAEREHALLMMKADDRYDWFCSNFDELEQALSQELIASFLGITSVHLSRIRCRARVGA